MRLFLLLMFVQFCVVFGKFDSPPVNHPKNQIKPNQTKNNNPNQILTEINAIKNIKKRALSNPFDSFQERCKYNEKEAKNGGACKKNVVPINVLGMNRFVDAYCEKGTEGVISSIFSFNPMLGLAKNVLSNAPDDKDLGKVGKRTKSNANAAMSILGVFIKDNNADKDCLAEINDLVDRGFIEANAAIDELTKEVKEHIEKISKSLSFKDTFLRYSSNVQATIHSIANAHRLLKLEDLSNFSVRQFFDKCNDDHVGIESAIVLFNSYIVQDCEEYDQCVVDEFIKMHSDCDALNITLKVELLKMIANDAIQLNYYAMFCKNQINKEDTSTALNETFESYNKLIGEALFYAENQLMKCSIDNIQKYNESIPSLFKTELDNAKTDDMFKIGSRLKSHDLKSMAVAFTVDTYAEYQSGTGVSVENIVDYFNISCPRTTCLCIPRLYNTHLFLKASSLAKLKDIIQAAEIYKNTQNERQLILNKFHDNYTAIVEAFMDIFPYNETKLPYMGWGIFYKTDGDFRTLFQTDAPNVNLEMKLHGPNKETLYEIVVA